MHIKIFGVVNHCKDRIEREFCARALTKSLELLNAVEEYLKTCPPINKPDKLNPQQFSHNSIDLPICAF